MSANINSVISTASAQCQAVYGQLSSILGAAESLVAGPRALLNAISNLLNNSVNTLLHLANIENILEEAGIGNLANMHLPNTTQLRASLAGLLQCAALPESMRASAQELMGIIDAGASAIEDLPRELLEDVFSAVQDAVTSQIQEALKGSVLGKLANLNSVYSILLDQMGITDILDMADGLLNCLDAACGTIEGMPEAIDSYMDSVSHMYDSIGAAPGEVASFVTGIGTQVGTEVSTAFDNAVKQIEAAKNAVKYF